MFVLIGSDENNMVRDPKQPAEGTVLNLEELPDGQIRMWEKKMTLETGLIWAIAIMTLGGMGLAGFAIWLRKKPRYPRDDGTLSETASKRIRQIAQPILQKGEVLSQRNLDDWLAENKEAIESSNDYVEKHGLPLGTLRGSVVRYEDLTTPVDVEWDAMGTKKAP